MDLQGYHAAAQAADRSLKQKALEIKGLLDQGNDFETRQALDMQPELNRLQLEAERAWSQYRGVRSSGSSAGNLVGKQFNAISRSEFDALSPAEKVARMSAGWAVYEDRKARK